MTKKIIFTNDLQKLAKLRHVAKGIYRVFLTFNFDNCLMVDVIFIFFYLSDCPGPVTVRVM